MTARLLVVDDEATLRESLTALLRDAGYSVHTAFDVPSALAALTEEPFDLVLTDLKMPGASGDMEERAGHELLLQIGRLHPGTPVVVLTGHATIETAVDAMKAGAADYVLKPFRRVEICRKVESALDHSRLRRVVEDRMRSELPDRITARSPAMAALLETIARVAGQDVTVLVSGPPGCGKERVARAIHAARGAPTARFVAFSCGGTRESLFEDALFGHERGAFSGADRIRRGLVEEAAGGTLFLDGVEDTPLAVQSSLLTAIEKRVIQRIGGSRPIPVSARIVASTSADLRELVRREAFRADLYYALRVVHVEIPPLRERPEDVPCLAREFLEEIGHAQRRNLRLADAALEVLGHHDWPGNIRELRNLVESCVSLSADGTIDADVVASALRLASGASVVAAPPVRDVVRHAERERIRRALARHPRSLADAAKDLGVSRTTLWRKLQRHGLDPVE